MSCCDILRTVQCIVKFKMRLYLIVNNMVVLNLEWDFLGSNFIIPEKKKFLVLVDRQLLFEGQTKTFFQTLKS